MICSIHQPNFLPYLGLFDKIASSDIFVIYDTAQYTKGDYHNRNSVKGPNGKILLSLPVRLQMGQKISEVTYTREILPKFLQTFRQSYKKAVYFSEIYPLLEDIFGYETDSLALLNEYALRKICDYLTISTKIVKMSEIYPDCDSTSTLALKDICQKVSADTYLSGSGGRDYIEQSIFADASIELLFQDFKHPVYPQLWGDFIPYLSIMDSLFCLGKDTRKLLHS